VLQHHALDPLWGEVRHWSGIDAEDFHRLNHLTQEGNLLHLSGTSGEQRVGYRHDRVRDWLLIDAADQLAVAGMLPSAVVGEPYFAEVIGGLVARRHVRADFVSRVRTENPLALFYALHLLTETVSDLYRHIVTAIEEWLSDPSAWKPSN